MSDVAGAAEGATESSGNHGAAAPNDAATPEKVRTYSDEEVNTFAAKARREGAAKAAADTQKQWLEKLGVTSLDEAVERLSRPQEQPKPKKSEAESVAEKVSADYEAKLQKVQAALEQERQARIKEREEQNRDKLRGFVAGHLGDTTNPALASVLFGLPYEAKRHLSVSSDGKVVVVEEGTELPHLDPEKWIKEELGKPELAFLRKPQSAGSGTRVGGSASTPAAVTPKPTRKLSMQEQVDAAVMAGLQHAAGANGRSR